MASEVTQQQELLSNHSDGSGVHEVKKKKKPFRKTSSENKNAAANSGSGTDCSKPSIVSSSITFWDEKKFDAEHTIVKCSSCGNQVNHHDYSCIKVHPHLKVLICKECSNFYGEGDFSQDENGDKYCRWCGQGGQLYICDYCTNAFCVKCIRRNFGRKECSRLVELKWKCYICEPKQIADKVAFCEFILKYALSCKMARNNAKNKRIKMRKDPVAIDLLGSDICQPSQWLPSVFMSVGAVTERFRANMEKLRCHSLTGNKSTKQIVKKLEEVICDHKNSLRNIMLTVDRRYNTYIKKKLSDSSSVINLSSESENAVKDNGPQVCESSVLNSSAQGLAGDIISEGNKSAQLHISLENGIVKTSKFPADEICVLQNNLDTVANDKLEIQPLKKLDLSHSFEAVSRDETNDSEVICVEDDKTEEVKDPISPTPDPIDNKASNISDADDVNAAAKCLLLLSSDSENSEASTVPNFSGEEIPTNKQASTEKSRIVSTDSDESISSNEKTHHRKLKSKSKSISKSHYFPESAIVDKSDYKDDPKLNSKAVVIVEKLPFNPSFWKSEEVPKPVADTDDELLAELEKNVKSLKRIPTPRKHPQDKKNSDKVVEKKPKVKKQAELIPSSASDSFSLSSDEENTTAAATNAPKQPYKSINDQAKEALLNLGSSDSSAADDGGSSDSSIIVQKVKNNKRKAKSANSSDSDDDFQISKSVRSKKSDRLLKEPINISDEDKKKNNKEKEKKTDNNEKRKGAKRKIVYSDDSQELSDSDPSDSDSSSSVKKKKKPKQKKRRVQMADEMSDDETQPKSSQDTPNKGRKNIRKVISDKKLTETTREAQEAEKLRLRRIAERQKLYNKIVEKNADGNDVVTRKMVLEVDSESKEEIVEIEPELVEKLKPHQVEGVKFMWECTIESVKLVEKGKPGSGGILAHCMGLGKTLQVIAYVHTVLTNKILKKKLRTVLIICPYNTVLNWENEFEKWLDGIGGINVYNLTSVKTNYDRCDLLQQWHDETGVMIIGYRLFSRLADGKIPRARKKLINTIFELLCDPGADIVICDEGHLLKNEASALSRSATKIKSRRRIVLTGTPLQNNLKEYYCMMNFVKPNLLGTLKEFTNRFVNPINNGQYDNSSKYDVKLMKKRVHILHKLLEGCVQRCDYTALTKFLPAKHEYVISVQLSEVQIELYRYFLENKSTKGTDTRLFEDFNVLKNIWTYPHNLIEAYYRREKKKFDSCEDDEESMGSFIDDSPSESSKSSSSSSADEEEILKDDLDPGNNTKSNAQRTSKYTTRSQAGLPEDDDFEAEHTSAKGWFSGMISEEDKYKIENSGKMVLLFEILKECESIGDKVLVFSQSLVTLDMIELLLKHFDENGEKTNTGDSLLDDAIGSWVPGVDYFRMDGKTNVENRKYWFDIFNDRENIRARLFLISTKAGSLGANLVGANRVVLMDASWNPSHDVQAIFRVYRFGQTKPVYVYRLLAQGTMEEKIYNRQVTKLSMSFRVVDEQQIDRHFNAADLAELYTFDPDTSTNRPTLMVPKDRLLADILMRHSKWVVRCHEHDSLLQCSSEDDLTEEERQAAWQEYENEKEGISANINNINMQGAQNAGKEYFSTSNIPPPLKIYYRFVEEVNSKNPNISPLDLNTRLLAYMKQVRTFYQTQHVQALRMKQQFISANQPVPQNVTQYLYLLENYQTQASSLIASIQQSLTTLESNLHRATNMQYPNRMPFNLNTGHQTQGSKVFFVRVPMDTNMPNQYPTVRPTGGNVPGSNAPTVIDITSDQSAYDISGSSSTPVITEVDEVSTSAATGPPQSTRSETSRVQITEID